MVQGLAGAVAGITAHSYEAPFHTDFSLRAYGRTLDEARALHELLVNICQTIVILPPIDMMPVPGKPWQLEAMLEVHTTIGSDRGIAIDIPAPDEHHSGYRIGVFPIGYDLTSVSVPRSWYNKSNPTAMISAANGSALLVSGPNHVTFYLTPRPTPHPKQ